MKTLHWANESLSDPEFDLYETQDAILVVDLEKPKEKSIDEILNDLVKIVIEWNVRRTYSGTFYNCQHYVLEIMRKVLLIENFAETESSQLIKDIVANLQQSADYKWESLLKEEKYQQFKSHKDLDEYVLKKESINIDEWYFLKTFDRAHWLNLLTINKRLKEKQKLLNEANYRCKNLLLDDKKTLKIRIENTLRSSFFQHPKFLEKKKHSDLIDQLRCLYCEFDSDYQEIQLKKLLIELWKIFIDFYSNNQIPQMEKKLKLCEPFNVEDIPKELNQTEIKLNDEKEEEKDEEKIVEENEEIKKIDTTFENHLCPFENPLMTGSLIQKKSFWNQSNLIQ